MMSIDWPSLVAIVLAVVLALLVAGSLRRAFRRPGPNRQALQEYSLSTGRGMILVAVLVSVIVTRPSSDWAASVVVGTAMLAVALQMTAETRWPRQSGAVRVALLRRPLLLELVSRTHLAAAGAAGAAAVVAATFCLTVGSGVLTRSPDELLESCSSEIRTICYSGDFGNSVVPGFTRAAPGPVPGLVASALLVLLALLVTMAIRQVLRRRPLAGVDGSVDRWLRTVAVDRLLRAFAAACLGVALLLVNGLDAALRSYDSGRAGLPEALGEFLTLVQYACAAAIFVLYILGPNERRLARAGDLLAREPV